MQGSSFRKSPHQHLQNLCIDDGLARKSLLSAGVARTEDFVVVSKDATTIDQDRSESKRCHHLGCDG